MEFIIMSGEPLHGAVARFAKNRNQKPHAALRVLLRGARGESLSFILPTHLDAFARNLPSALGVTAGCLLQNNSFFPAVAPFLEEDERSALRTMLFEGKKPIGYPICGGRHATAIAQTIRYCPKCAAEDREPGPGATRSLCGARWRREHNLFGIVACWIHGCALITTEARFADVRILHEAESVIPESLPEINTADESDVALARDLRGLFLPGCPRPGRRRIAAALRNQAAELGLELSHRQIDQKAIELRIRETYSEAWLERQGITFTAVSTSWGRMALCSSAQVFPAITTALLARALGMSLPELLAAAIKEEPIKKTKAGQRNPSRWVKAVSHEEVEARRARFLALRKANPHFTRSEIYRAANHLMSLMSHNDAEWLQANLPAKKQMAEVATFDWSEMDSKAAHEVRQHAELLRAGGDKPVRITETRLRRASGQRGRTGPNWAHRLPLLHQALREGAETDLQYAHRRVMWLEGEISAGRRPAFHGGAYLQHAGLDKLVEKHLEIRELVVRMIEGRGTMPMRRSRGCARLALNGERLAS